jgi:hypothetical protein
MLSHVLRKTSGSGHRGASSAFAKRTPGSADAPEGCLRCPDIKRWLDKQYSVNEDWIAQDRRNMRGSARDMSNSIYVGLG